MSPWFLLMRITAFLGLWPVFLFAQRQWCRPSNPQGR